LLVAVGSKFVWRLKKVIFDFFLFIVYFYKLELLTEKNAFSRTKYSADLYSIEQLEQQQFSVRRGSGVYR